MSDLATVKAAVKSWEKSFRSREGRDPTKDDIKRDPGDIAKQYALYRKLSKSSASSSQSQSQSSSSRSQRPLIPPSTASSSQTYLDSQSQSRSQTSLTPRNIPSSEYPTTPTPPSRRSSSGISRSYASTSQIQPAFSSTSGQPAKSGIQDFGTSRSSLPNTAGPARELGDSKFDARSLKRKASKAAFEGSDPHHSSSPPLSTSITASTFGSSSLATTTSSTSTARALFTTPKKKKAYTGPVHDPNPINPFTISTPTKSSPLHGGLASSNSKSNGNSTLKHTNSSESPFIHASSPRKLKEVLEANSLQRVKERTGSVVKNEVTPRTRARKRLRGEQVEDTPMKDKLPRRRRGQIGQGQSHGQDLGSSSAGAAGFVPSSDDVGFLDLPGGRHDAAFEDHDEDELGPSPMKGLSSVAGKGFTSLFGEVEAETRGQGKGTESIEGSEHRIKGSGVSGGCSGQDKLKLSETRRRGRPSEMMGLFGRLGKSTIQPKEATPQIESEDHRNEATNDNDENGNRLSSRASPTPDVSGGSSSSIGIQVQASPSPSPAPLIPQADDVVSNGVAAQTSLDVADFGLAHEGSDSPDRTPSASQQRKKVISLSDDEQDEWDPEGGHVRRHVFIVPTRREVKRRNSDSSDLVSGAARGSSGDDEGEERVEPHEDDGHHNADATEQEQEGPNTVLREHRTTDSSVGPLGNPPGPDNASSSSRSPFNTKSQSNGHLTLPMLNLLSLRSPSKTKAGQTRAKLEELRVKALFDSTARAQLKALRRGQDIAFTGESRDVDDVEEDEEGILERYEFGLKERRRSLSGGDGEGETAMPGDGFEAVEGEGDGDDDWEEESDGWKREQLDEDW
ncbi:hypothetical protein I317_07135 [Kwoniella heveanensis CBS 569]|nr:hypothetical protein I317_07135 [Kwoniella heveanensis CBS 569]